jgi:hypothetical protein
MPSGRGFRLWLPLFLLWIPAILLAPLLLLIYLVFSLAGRIAFGRCLAALWRLLCALPGTDVQIEDQGKYVLVRLR